MFVILLPKLVAGANPTIASYNASVANFYNATVAYVFKTIILSLNFKNALFYYIHTYNAGVVVVNLKVVGLGPGKSSAFFTSLIFFPQQHSIVCR
jgi:hypothetical protein